jgi:hypothetical protein
MKNPKQKKESIFKKINKIILWLIPKIFRIKKES